MWLNEKHIEEGLDHKTLREITIKYHSGHRKSSYEQVEEPKKQVDRIFIDAKLATKVFMNCRTTLAHIFKKRLGFKLYDVILTKEQSKLTKIMSLFESENMKTQHSVLSYSTDLYFKDYKLAIEIDEDGRSYRNIDDKIKRQKVTEPELGCKFIRIDPDKAGYF